MKEKKNDIGIGEGETYFSLSVAMLGSFYLLAFVPSKLAYLIAGIGIGASLAIAFILFSLRRIKWTMKK